jgi:hypothetical protein
MPNMSRSQIESKRFLKQVVEMNNKGIILSDKIRKEGLVKALKRDYNIYILSYKNVLYVDYLTAEKMIVDVPPINLKIEAYSKSILYQWDIPKRIEDDYKYKSIFS